MKVFSILIILIMTGSVASAGVFQGLIPRVLSIHFLPLTTVVQTSSDARLAEVRIQDRSARNSRGVLSRLSPEEHMRRAAVYHTNRAFDEAREHWQALINYYPDDARVPEALFGMGRSAFQSRRYAEAYNYYDKLARTYSHTKEGREGLNFSGAALLRMGRASEASDRYIEYINRFPDGERVDTAHLNAIDSLREASRNQEAIDWVNRTRRRFAGSPVETNAIFGQLRLYVAEGDWQRAIATADELSRRGFTKTVATTPGEIAYLKAYSLDRAGRQSEAITAYLSVPNSIDSYYGWLANERLSTIAGSSHGAIISDRAARTSSQANDLAEQYPAPYRQAIIASAKSRKLDPRFILAIIKQESVFRPLAKSPAGARGLLQLTIDAAHKYAANAGVNGLRENQLYQPETSIAIGSEYLRELFVMFPNQPEAVAASYNGGEDNVARWVKRAKHKDPGVLTSEVGFDETKRYVQKVMNNYRVYRQLYNADLTRR